MDIASNLQKQHLKYINSTQLLNFSSAQVRIQDFPRGGAISQVDCRDTNLLNFPHPQRPNFSQFYAIGFRHCNFLELFSLVPAKRELLYTRSVLD